MTTQDRLLSILRVGVGFSDVTSIEDGVDWQTLYHEAAAQGVLAVTWRGVERLMSEGVITDMPRNIKLQWAISAERIEGRYRHQEAMAKELATRFAENGIESFVLKGFAISRYYPEPSLRESGDLDCFLGDDYERGNVVAEQTGATVRRDHYKHSHIHYRGLMVENHQFCTAIRGEQRRKTFERHLQHLLAEAPHDNLDGTKLLLPSADFNALFLTAHAFEHFLAEGIRLRHLVDWALLLHHEQENIDWKSFYEQCELRGLTIFANTMNSLVERYLGVVLSHPDIQRDERYAERVLRDAFASEGVFNRKVSPMYSRMLIVWNRVASLWKYHKIYRRSMLWDVTRLVWALVAERKPRL